MYSIGKFSKLVGVTTQTLRNWHKTEELVPCNITKGGTRYYSDEQLHIILNKSNEVTKIVIGYCRVSSSKQKDDLERQVSNMNTYLLAQGKPFNIITDIGSGINYTKPGLKQLIKLILENKVSKIVIFYKDRLVRFGFELIEQITTLYNCSIEIIDSTEKSKDQELVEDLIQIITVFSCRLHGKRAHKTKKFIEELVNSND